MDVCADQSSSQAPQQQKQDESSVRSKRIQQQQQQKQSQQQQQQQASQLGKQKSSDALGCLTTSSVAGGANGEQEGTPTGSSMDTTTSTSSQNGNMDADCAMELMDDLDEEQLKRILACKRLSEGCNRFVGANLICRKNSLHMMGESLAPVTEGEPMRHMSHHMSQNIESSTSSSSMSSGSFRSSNRVHLGGHTGGGGLMSKRSSQDDTTNSCSSSTSLDGPRSPTTRRRSSTVSQCSSVLSEGTRQQLNFDLSPDLAPDSSILEANAISPTDFERPASPEPRSLGSADNSFEMRPISGLSSQFCDDVMLTSASPDSTLGDSNESSNPPNPRNHFTTDEIGLELEPNGEQSNEHTGGTSERPGRLAVVDCEQYEETIRDNLERIISHVSTVKVSSSKAVAAETQQDSNALEQTHTNGAVGQPAHVVANGQKRAHTPFGANLQRNKTSLISSSPSPTSYATKPLA